jgi:hypothetical protein
MKRGYISLRLLVFFENEISFLKCNFIASRLRRERMHRCFESRTGVWSL